MAASEERRSGSWQPRPDAHPRELGLMRGVRLRAGPGETGLLDSRHEALRLLLVEDNPGDARLVQEALKEARGMIAEVEVAETLAAAVQKLENGTPNVILLDLGLPDASGLDALYRLEAHAPRIPIIVLTGQTDEELALQALRGGAQDYLSKVEVSGSLLARALRYAIERKRLRLVEEFISSAAQLLGSSLSLEDTLAQLADLSVANLADYCAVDLVNSEGKLERLLVAYRHEDQRPLAERLRRQELDRTRPSLATAAAETGKAVLVETVTEEHLASITQSPSHGSLLRDLRIRSYMGVPLLAHQRLVGLLVLICSTRSFTRDDLELAMRLAHVAAAAVNNARLYEQSAEALRTRDRVLGVVAHDLRNPLGAITMGAELLLEENLPELSKHKQIQLIRRAADRMDGLIEDLLDVARIEHGELTLEKSYQQPERIVEESIEANGALAHARELQLVADHDGCGPIFVDYNRIIQVMSNLIGNSIKFTPPGGTIRVGCDALPDHIQFHVSDTGPGIEKDEIEQLFRPFWQGRGKAGGAGLGLSIARGIVEAHGGRIWAESSPGVGTTMYFTIPSAPERRGAG